MDSLRLDQCPYKGLLPFGEEDAPFFFGREADRQIVIANLHASRLTVLYGPSGVGKSSILHAGVAHQLHQEPQRAVVIFSAWHEQPLAQLKRAIAGEVERARGAPAPTAAPPAQSRDIQLPLADLLTACAEGLRCPLVIMLDQFEEYFLYASASSAAGERFEAELARAINLPSCPATFLISIREDALAKLDRFERRIPQLFDTYLRIEHLDRAAARQAIVGPLAVYNERVAPEQRVTIEDGLADAIVDEVSLDRALLGVDSRGLLGAGRGPGAGKGIAGRELQIEAPYLQLVLTRLWDEEQRRRSRQLRLSTLTALGGAEQIVRSHLDRVMARLTPGEQEDAASIFHYLVTPSGTKIALAPADLASFAGLPERRVAAVLEHLAGSETRVLRAVTPFPEGPAGAGSRAPVRYEIFHDVLAPAVLDWRVRYLARAWYSRRLLLAAAAALAAIVGVQLIAGIPLLALGVARLAGLVIVNAVPLAQLYRWFSRYTRLTSVPQATASVAGPNLGALLGALLTVLWYALTQWPDYTAPDHPLSTLRGGDYLAYHLVVMLTLLAGMAVFFAMRAAGQLTFLWRGSFAAGYYGTFFGTCTIVVLLAGLKLLGMLPEALRITF